MAPEISLRKFLSKLTSLGIFNTGAPTNTKRQKQTAGFTTTSEGENESLLSFFLNAVGAKPASDHKAAGFTLVELLVVIAIIGLLASAIFSSFSGAKESARDAVRLRDFDQMTTALEMYNLKFGVYPCGDAAGTETQDGEEYTIDTSLSDGFLSGAGGRHSGCPDGPLTGIDDVGLYPQHTREDPINEEESYYYTYQATFDRNDYLLYVPLENTEKAAEDGGLCDNYYEVGSGVGEIHIVEKPRYHDIPVPCN